MSKRASLGQEIAAARERAGLSQAQMATKLRVSVTQVSRWERGLQVPGGASIRALTDLLDLDKSRISELAIDASAEDSKDVRRQLGQKNDQLLKVIAESDRRMTEVMAKIDASMLEQQDVSKRLRDLYEMMSERVQPQKAQPG